MKWEIPGTTQLIINDTKEIENSPISTKETK